uniref:Putative phosphotransferase enzyme family protein n=1 Tax=viral metagenome TaxID=1070528 RepID=A0A6M3J934_9ZZZZ
MMKASLRKYDYVMKTRTDYLPPMTIPEMMKEDKIIVDGCANWYRRYPDRFDILWQGSLNDIFCFATTEQFLKLWDFEDILKSVWTGIPETTLFRAAMKRFLGDDMQSPRRNENFLKKYFVWDENDTKQSFHVMRRRHSLPKPDEATYFKGDEVIKYFVDKKRVSGKVERAKLLEGFVPPVRKVSDNFFTYKYVEGDLLSDCDSITFARFLEFMKSFWQPIEVKDFPWTCLEFYQNKTFQRLDLMREKVNIHTCVINGVEVPPIYVATEKLGWNWLSEGKAVRFHGDPQLENVIVTPEGFSLIDWREDFGGVKEYGDIYYDLAKIYHALIVNGEVIRSGGYSITEGDTVEYTLETKENLREFKEMMERFILDNGYDLKKVKTLSALIYLNSAPLHEEPYNRFLYYFGRKMLREVR